MRFRSHMNAGLAALALVAVLGLTAQPLAAQLSGSIRGQVVEGATQRPLSGVVVSIAGTNQGALTNARGAYLLLNVPAGTHTLVVQMIGYSRAETTVTVEPGETAELNFQLSQSAIELDGLVVTGTPGVVQRRTLGNTVSAIQGAEIAEVAPMTSVTQMLTARTPSLTVMSPSGQVGAAADLKIRGAASLAAGNQPVFYVDGVRVRSGSQGGFGTGNQTVQFTSYLDTLNPDDIESIEVIKGPAAATLYGADAAAGVIQIITKKGRAGQQSVQWTGRVEMGQTDWHLPMRENFTLCTTPGELFHTPAARIGHNSWPGCADVDPSLPWEQRVIRETPLAQDGVLRTGSLGRYALSARGGGDRYSFYVSGEREEEDGVFWNNFMNRTTGRANFTILPYEDMDLTFTVQYSTSDAQAPLNDNASNGWLRNSWRGRPGQTSPYAPGWLGLGPEEMKIYDNQISNERWILGSTLDYRPTEWFRTRLTLGFDAGDRVNTLFYPIDRTGRAPYGAANAAGYISHFQPTTRDYTVDYSGTITSGLPGLSDAFTSSFSFGAQYLAQNYRSTQVVGEQLPAEALRLISSAAVTRAFESREEERSLGFFVQEQVGWNNRLFVTAGVRMDDHSAFGANFSRIFYPKASVSWVISEEPFFNLGMVDNLRLRGSYGHAGNAPAPFQADQTYESATNISIDGIPVPAFSPDAYGNPDLRAERGVEYELGFDASFLNDAVGLEVTYYNQETRDALMHVPVPPSSAFRGTTLKNVGTIRNSGIEVSIFGSPIRTPTVSWDARLIFSTNNNEMVEFGDVDRDFIPLGFRNSQRHVEGYPLAGYWAEVPLRDESGNLVLSAAGRPILDALDMEFVGTPLPTREAALTNTLTLFRDFQLYTHLDYKGGHYLFNMSEQTSFTMDGNNRLANDPTISEEEWLLLRWGGNRRFFERADFVKLREVSLRYNLPSEWAQLFRTQGMSLMVAGRNLAVWSDYSGADPEVNIAGSHQFIRAESNTAPMMRQFVTSVNFRF